MNVLRGQCSRNLYRCNYYCYFVILLFMLIIVMFMVYFCLLVYGFYAGVCCCIFVYLFTISLCWSYKAVRSIEVSWNFTNTLAGWANSLMNVLESEFSWNLYKCKHYCLHHCLHLLLQWYSFVSLFTIFRCWCLLLHIASSTIRCKQVSLLALFCFCGFQL